MKNSKSRLSLPRFCMLSNFEGKIHLLDTTTINLCLEVFPWATFRKTKGAIKLHTGLDADGYLPAFMDMTEGKTHEIQWARSLQLPPRSCVIFDRGFTDSSWYQKLSGNKIFFVTRLKKNAVLGLEPPIPLLFLLS